ncbi:MAG TPA: hypothetical protein VMP68_24380 [Candidatus Eisenbacteria bacterium]|nr:hypothetical protein [Candidatus Eisenbacteria bacterium]
MYVFFEYLGLVGLTALLGALLFAASIGFVMVGEGIAAVLRISRTAVSTATLAKAFERAR